VAAVGRGAGGPAGVNRVAGKRAAQNGASATPRATPTKVARSGRIRRVRTARDGGTAKFEAKR
jgi:hypothetical protein